MRNIKYVMAPLLLSLLAVLLGCATSGKGITIDELRSKADQGDVTAQAQLCMVYDLGIGVTRDQAQAAAWCRKAAEQGNAAAQNSLGSMYQNGEGVAQDNAEAVQWYQKAADQGYSVAYTNLGYMYESGLGVGQDKGEAVTLYHLGAERGSITAMLNLGVSYWQGKGVTRDLEQAFMWLDLARLYTQQSRNVQLRSKVRETLDGVTREMTKDQIRRAEQLSRDWDARHRSK